MKPLLLAIAAVAITAATTPATVYGPAEAIALAKTTANGRSGRFEMTVVSTGVTPNGTFLNSSSDYKSDDNLTFHLSPMVARMLAKRYRAAPDAWLKGKHVVVDGNAERKLIVNTLYGRVRSGNRYQHEVDVDRVEQVVAAG